MGYCDNGTSAHRNNYFVYGTDYNRMMLQAEMTANAFARQNPSMDMNAFAKANANAVYDAVTSALRAERNREWEAAEQQRIQAEYETNCRIAYNKQKSELRILDSIVYGTGTQVANLPETRAEAFAVCEYIKKNNAYPAPWGFENLTADYRNLVQALLNNADERTIKSLTKICVNNWIVECRLLHISAKTHEILSWQKKYETIVVLQN